MQFLLPDKHACCLINKQSLQHNSNNTTILCKQRTECCDKRVWLTRWPPWSITNPVSHSCLH